jgi:hypothetical protein
MQLLVDITVCDCFELSVEDAKHDSATAPKEAVAAFVTADGCALLATSMTPQQIVVVSCSVETPIAACDSSGEAMGHSSS